MKVAAAIENVQDSEREFGRHLTRFGERHAVEHDLYHTANTLARQAEQHLAMIAPFAQRYSARIPANDVASSPGVLEQLRRKGSELLGRSEATGLVLLTDLRDVYVAAQGAELAWVILDQVAQAVRDAELHQAVTKCHEAAEMRGKWIRTRIKEAALCDLTSTASSNASRHGSTTPT